MTATATMVRQDHENDFSDSDVETLFDEWSIGTPSSIQKCKAKLNDSAATFPADESENENEENTEGNDEILDILDRAPSEAIGKPMTEVEAVDLAQVNCVNELLQEWDGNSLDECDDEKRVIDLKDCEIDHIVLAAPNLEDAIYEFERMCGVAPVPAHAVKGLGICCAHISFNDSSFLEIIAPDHDGEPGPIGNLIKSRRLQKLTPFHYAIRSSRLDRIKKDVREFGYTPDHITLFSGYMDGLPRKWDTMYLYGHKLGGICPYFVDWSADESIHPCHHVPILGKLKKFHIRAPAGDPIHQLFDRINVKGVYVEEGKSGKKAKLSFQFSSPEGTVKFSTGRAVGFKFPGFDDVDNLNINDSQVFSESELDFNDSHAALSVDLLPITNLNDEELPSSVV